jgi:membrane dipeptidase
MNHKESYTDVLGFLADINMPTVDDPTCANIKASGVKLFHTTTTWPMQDWNTTLAMHRQSVTILKNRPDVFVIVGSRQDLARVREENKIGIILGIQDPDCIGTRLDRVEQLYTEGIRITQIAYQRKGRFGSGFLVDADDRGLTEDGRQFVETIHRAGLILDLSHTAPQTALDCLQISGGPTMISHTCCRGVYDHPRGTTDSVLAEIVRQKDVIVGVLAMTFFLSADDDGLDPMIHHIRHLAEHIGADRVAIGTDAPVGGFTDLNGAQNLFHATTQEMMDPHGELKSRWPTHIPAFSEDYRGFERLGLALAPYFSDEEIGGILEKNARRYFDRHLPTG